MSDIIRKNADGIQEIKTGLGWRKVVSSSSTDAEIPIIDISDINHPDLQTRQALAKSICDAAISSGFFYVKNHGIPDEDIINIFREAKRFFHRLSLEEKMEYDTAKHEHYYGYYPIDTNPDSPSGAKLNEGINYGYEPTCDDPSSTEKSDNWWPPSSQLPGYKQVVKQHMSHMLHLSRSLLRLFALGLSLPEHTFTPLATHPYSILKMAHYPGDYTSTIRPHTDFELVTILLQDNDIGGLEVLGANAEWIKAVPVKGTFVVNIGDSLSMLSNGILRSTMHRVVNVSGRARYSVPFFLGANQDTEIKAVEKFVTKNNPAKFQPVNSKEYIRMSLQGVYSKPGMETTYDTVEVK